MLKYQRGHFDVTTAALAAWIVVILIGLVGLGMMGGSAFINKEWLSWPLFIIGLGLLGFAVVLAIKYFS